MTLKWPQMSLKWLEMKVESSETTGDMLKWYSNNLKWLLNLLARPSDDLKWRFNDIGHAGDLQMTSHAIYMTWNGMVVESDVCDIQMIRVTARKDLQITTNRPSNVLKRHLNDVKWPDGGITCMCALHTWRLIFLIFFFVLKFILSVLTFIAVHVNTVSCDSVLAC